MDGEGAQPVYVTLDEYEAGQAALDEALREIRDVIEGYLQEG